MLTAPRSPASVAKSTEMRKAWSLPLRRPWSLPLTGEHREHLLCAGLAAGHHGGRHMVWRYR